MTLSYWQDNKENEMKIIDDEMLFDYQKEWFKTQFKGEENSGVWNDFKSVDVAYKMSRDDFFDDVKHLRTMLNGIGLKRLNNAISARRKRMRRKNYKSIQINVEEAIADKFNTMCAEKNMTQSELFENMIRGEVQMSLFK